VGLALRALPTAAAFLKVGSKQRRDTQPMAGRDATQLAQSRRAGDSSGNARSEGR